MRPIIKFKKGRAPCPLCFRKTEGFRKYFKSVHALRIHFKQYHSYRGQYKYTISSEPNRRGNHTLTVKGTCGCGCGEKVDYSIPYMPAHPPPYYLSGHLSKVQNNNAGRFRRGCRPWNTGTKGVCKPNSGSFQKGHVPHQDRGGIRNEPNGQVYEFTGEYQPSGTRKYKARSRRIMEEILGRALNNHEVVVHLDNDSSNDDPSNLKVITRGENATRNRWGRSSRKSSKKTSLKSKKRVIKPETTIPNRITSWKPICSNCHMMVLPGELCNCMAQGEGSRLTRSTGEVMEAD